ncbi:efflux RND transporter periplasmic adaptor subunit [candidate division WOR-3 bacterium]|nr:efflux RND transporter periplasmic adaptor subunit [candidate division WOR-3 bacterium]
MSRIRDISLITRLTLSAVVILVLAVSFVFCFVKFDIVVRARGKIEPQDCVGIRPLIKGVIKAVLTDDGEAVNAGDILLTLDATELLASTDKVRQEVEGLQARLNQYRIKLGAAREDLSITRAAYKNISAEISETPINTDLFPTDSREIRLLIEDTVMVMNAIGRAKAELAASNHFLEHSSLIAPCSGVIWGKDIKKLEGTCVDAGELLFAIGSNEKWVVRGVVSEKDVPDVQIGQPARVFIDALPYTKYKVFTGSVAKVYSVAEEKEILKNKKAIIFEVLIAIDDAALDGGCNLSPGMSATAEILVKKADLVSFMSRKMRRQ